MGFRLFDSDRPMAYSNRAIDCEQTDVALDTNGDGNTTVNFDEGHNFNRGVAYAIEVRGQTPAMTAVDQDNAGSNSADVYVSNGPADTTITIMCARMSEF